MRRRTGYDQTFPNQASTKQTSNKNQFSDFRNETGLISFLSKHSDKIVPFTMFKTLYKYETVVRFLERNIALKGYPLLFKIFTSPELLNHNILEEKTRIYMIFFKNNEFTIKQTLKATMIYFFQNDIISFQQSISFLKALATSVPRQIYLLKNFAQSLMNGYLNDYGIHLMSYFNQIENQIITDKTLFEQIYPSHDEIAQSSFLQNQFQTGYSSPEHLRNTLLSLEKSSFLLPMIQGLQNLETGELDPRDLFLYQNVYLIPVFSDEIEASAFLHFEVRAPPGDKKVFINWSKSNRLDHNNLLILSKDPFCKTYDAICLSRARASPRFKESPNFIKLLNENIVPVQIVKGSIIPGQTYFMFENTEGWFTHETCLRSLLQINSQSFPKLSDAIIKHQFTNNNSYQPPNSSMYYSFFQFNQMQVPVQYDLSVLQNRNVCRVDKEQMAALKHFLYNPLTLVNGCPGSGKTHLAREIVRVLTSSNISTPIFLIAQTNHSIDAFLEGIIDFVDPSQIVRHGGKPRTTNPKILARVLSKRDVNEYLKEYRFYILSKKVKDIIRTEQAINFLISKFIEINSSLISFPEPEKASEHLFKKLCPILNTFFSFHFLLPTAFPSLDLPKKGNKNKYYWDYWLLNKKPTRIIITHANQFANLEDEEDSDDVIEERVEEPKFNSSDLFTFPKSKCIPQPPNRRIVNKSLPNQQDNEEEEEEEEDNGERDDLDYFINDDIPHYLNQMISNKFSDLIKPDEKPKSSSRRGNDFNDDSNNGNPFHSYLTEVNEIILDHLKDKSPDSAIKLMQHLISFFLKKRGELIEDRSKQMDDMRKAECLAYAKYYQEHKIVGMTATFANFYRDAINDSNCQYMIIEEAGELTEASTIGIIPKSIQHLALIGDYNQLRPKVEYQLTEKQNPRAAYDVSTLERLVRAQLNQKTHPDLFSLTVQRRIPPEITALFKAVKLCPEIKDAPETFGDEHKAGRGLLSHISFIITLKILLDQLVLIQTVMKQIIVRILFFSTDAEGLMPKTSQ